MTPSDPVNRNAALPANISEIVEDIVTQSERGVSEVLDASDAVREAINGLRRIIASNVQAESLLTDLENANSRVTAACSFQDIIRQHAQKLEKLGNKNTSDPSEKEKLLAGPQSDGQGLAQQEIDDLLE